MVLCKLHASDQPFHFKTSATPSSSSSAPPPKPLNPHNAMPWQSIEPAFRLEYEQKTANYGHATKSAKCLIQQQHQQQQQQLFLVLLAINAMLASNKINVVAAAMQSYALRFPNIWTSNVLYDSYKTATTTQSIKMQN